MTEQKHVGPEFTGVPEPQLVTPLDPKELDSVLQVPVTLSLEVGRTRMAIRELLKLNVGSVIEFERFAGEALDAYVNGTLIAHGEVVVINDKIGIRFTDSVSPAERVRNPQATEAAQETP
ncbi:MAG: flagellar motor switch protein FliN [Proteobacteria bacterium]|nr:flagellar motor switch protein FliN [Pseudomonadota bacterium]